MDWLNKVWVKIKALGGTVWTDLTDTYKRSKVFLLGLLALIVYFEWNKIKEGWTVKSANNEMKSADTKDAALAKTEATDNQQAEALVKQAQDLAAQPEPPITDDWNTKK